MTSLRHYDPLSIEPSSDMMQGMLRAFLGAADAGMVFKVDVTDSDGSYTITADLPGMKHEDIHINVDRGTVMIAARVERTTEQRRWRTCDPPRALQRRHAPSLHVGRRSTNRKLTPPTPTVFCGRCGPRRKPRRRSVSRSVRQRMQ